MGTQYLTIGAYHVKPPPLRKAHPARIIPQNCTVGAPMDFFGLIVIFFALIVVAVLLMGLVFGIMFLLFKFAQPQIRETTYAGFDFDHFNKAAFTELLIK